MQDQNGDTALHVATQHNNVAVVELLLSLDDIDANVKNADGSAPLHGAHQVATLEALLSSDKVDINIKDKDQQSLLVYSAERGNTGVVRVLLSKSGIDVNSVCEDQQTALHVMCDSFMFHELPGAYKEIVSVLVGHPDIDLNLKDSHGKTALDYADESPGLEALVEILQRKTSKKTSRK